MTLYLKYRAKNLDELDIEGVRTSLKKIFSQKEIPHAFLFAGPKGTGKASAARIVAKIINCQDPKIKDGEVVPCDECDECKSTVTGNNLDVIELDAASHRGIDDIRLLRDAVKLAPVAAKKKIYIIDEAHMLTTEASNALLKTLEEPPSHVVFILATTNPEKLIDTIRSRTTPILFTKATTDEIVRSLKRVIEGEKIKIDEDNLSLIAESGGGAFRDAIKNLEQLVSEGIELTKDKIEARLFSKDKFDLNSFVKDLSNKDIKKLLSSIEKSLEGGADIENILKLLMNKIKNIILVKSGVLENADDNLSSDFQRDDLIILLDLLTDASKKISDSPLPEIPLEVALVKYCGETIPVSMVEEEKKDENKTEKEKEEVKKKEPDKEKLENASAIQAEVKASGASDINDEIWKKILLGVKPLNASIEALLRASQPVSFDGKVLTLGVYYKFHKERLEESSHRRILEDVIKDIMQIPVRVDCLLTEPPPKKVIEEAKKEPVLTEGHDQDIVSVAEKLFSN